MDPYGCRWNNGLLIASIVVNSIAIAGYWSGGCCGCGYFNYYAGNGYGAGVCGYCTFWNGYQVRRSGRERGKKKRCGLFFLSFVSPPPPPSPPDAALLFPF